MALACCSSAAFEWKLDTPFSRWGGDGVMPTVPRKLLCIGLCKVAYFRVGELAFIVEDGTG